jgi:hypothetical protein
MRIGDGSHVPVDFRDYDPSVASRPQREGLSPLETPIRPMPTAKPKLKSRITHCPLGRALLRTGRTAEAASHKYEGANLGYTSKGGRFCRTCINTASRNQKRRQAEAKHKAKR